MIIFLLTRLFFVFCLINTGSCLRCYQCNQKVGLACDTSPRSGLTENCTSGFECIKYIWKYKDPSISVVSRHCAPESKCTELGTVQSERQTLTFCGICASDLCNAGVTLNSKVTWLIPSVLYVAMKIL